MLKGVGVLNAPLTLLTSTTNKCHTLQAPEVSFSLSIDITVILFSTDVSPRGLDHDSLSDSFVGQ